MKHFVGIGEMAISNQLEDSLITHALASCVGVTIYVPRLHVGGMIHVALPNRMVHSDIQYKSGYYADIGMPLFIRRFQEDYGCQLKDMDVRLFGGARSINQSDVFNIGKRNILAVEEILRAYGIPYDHTETGATISRTIELSISDGQVTMSTQRIRI